MGACLRTLSGACSFRFLFHQAFKLIGPVFLVIGLTTDTLRDFIFILNL